MAKILKNTTGSPITISDTGVTVPASPGQYTIPPQDYSLFAASSDVIGPIATGDILFNDGSNDYDGAIGFDISEAIDIIKDMQGNFVNTSENGPVSVVDEGGVKRLAIDIQDAITGPAGQTGPAGPTGPQGPAGDAFPSEWYYAESEGTSSTTSGTYQQKLRLTTGSLTGGDYLIAWAYEIESSDSRMNVKCELDDTTIINEHEFTDFGEDGHNRWFAFSGFRQLTLTAAVHNIDIDYNDGTAGTAYIRRARLYIHKVGS